MGKEGAQIVWARSIRDVLNASGLVVLGVWTLLMLDEVPTGTGALPVVYVIPIEGVIDLGLAPSVERVVNEATAAGGAGVILEIDTFGDGKQRGLTHCCPKQKLRSISSPVTHGNHEDTVLFVNRGRLSVQMLSKTSEELSHQAALVQNV